MDTSDLSEVTSFDQCPVPGISFITLDQERKRTDVFCTVCTSIFALALFIVSCVVFNNCTVIHKIDNLVKMTFFSDGVGNVCGFDLPDFPIVYFASLNDAVIILLFSQKDYVSHHVLNKGIKL